MNANINVVVKLHSDVLGWKIEGATLTTTNENFTFSHIFSKDSTNESIHDVIESPLLKAVIDGYDGTIITCGQPKSGKTHVIIGNDQNLGIISFAMDYLYEEMKFNLNKHYLLRFSLIEIVEEQLFDLLNDKIELGIDDNEISGAKENMICDKKAFLSDIKDAFAAQSVNSTVIIKLIIESQEDECVSVGCLTVMKVASTDRCVQSLYSAVHKRGHNYALTTLLNSSLGGGTNTAIICTINKPDNAEHLLSLMANAKCITNVPVKRNLNPSNSKLCDMKNWWSQKTKGLHKNNVPDYNQEEKSIFNIDANYIPTYIQNWTSQSKNTNLLETDLDKFDIMLKDENLSLINDDISSILLEDNEKTSDSSTETILNEDREIGWLIHGNQTPKSVLRQRVNYYKEEYLSLCEHTKLEKTLEFQSHEISEKIQEANNYDNLGVIGKLPNSENLFFVPELEIDQDVNKLDVISEEDESLIDCESISTDEIILMKLFKYMPSIMESVDSIKSDINSNESFDNIIEFLRSLSQRLNELTSDQLPDDMKVDLDSLNVLTTTTAILLDYEKSMSEKIAKTNSIINKFDQLKSKNESFRVIMREKDKEIEQLSDEIMQYVEKLSSCESKLFNVENLLKMDSEGIKHITEYLEKMQHSLLCQMSNLIQKFDSMFFNVNEKIILYEEQINKIKNENVTLINQLKNDQKIKEQTEKELHNLILNYNIIQSETDAEKAELRENLFQISLELSKQQSENNELQKLIIDLRNENEINSQKCKVVQQDVNISLALLKEQNMISDQLQSNNDLEQDVNTQIIQVSSVSQSYEHGDCGEQAISTDEKQRFLHKNELLTTVMHPNNVKCEEKLSHELKILHNKLEKQMEINDWELCQKNYEERLVELQQIIEMFTGKCKMYESENYILKKQVNELNIKIDKLQENNITLKVNCDKIELYKERFEELLEKHNVCDKNSQGNIKTINQLNSEIVKISKELEIYKNLSEVSNSSNYKAKCNELQQKLDLMKSTSEKQIEKIKELQEDLIALKDENKTINEQCTELHVSVVVLSELKDEKKTLEQHLKIEQLKLNSLTEENDRNKQKYQDLLIKLTKANELLSTLKTENEDLLIKLETFNAEKIELNKKIINLELIETDLAAANAEKDELKNKFGIMSSEKDRLENIILTLEQELNVLNEKNNTLIESNNSLSKIRDENDILQQKNDILLSKLEKFKQEHEDITLKLIESEKYKIEFEQKQCQFNTTNNNLEKQITEVKRLLAENIILNQEMEILREKLYNMKCNCETLDSNYKILESKYQQIQAENVRLQNHIDEDLAQRNHMQAEKKILQDEHSESIRKFEQKQIKLEKNNLELKQKYESLSEKYNVISFDKSKEIKELESKLADLNKNTVCATKNNVTSDEIKLVNDLDSLELLYSKIQDACDAGCKELEMFQSDLNNWKNNVIGPTYVLEDITNQQQSMKFFDNVHNEVKTILMNNNNNVFHDELYLWLTFVLSDNWSSSKSFQRKDSELIFNHILLCKNTIDIITNNNGVINSLRFKLNKLHQLGMPSIQIQTEIDDCKAYVRKQIKEYNSIEFTVKERMIRIMKFKLTLKWVQSNLPTDLFNQTSQNYHSEVNAIMDLQDKLSCMYKKILMEKNSQENEFKSILSKINSDKTNLHGKIKEMNIEISKLQSVLNSKIHINDALRRDCDDMRTRYSDLELQKQDLHLLNVSLKKQISDKISTIETLNLKLIEAQKQKQYSMNQLTESQELIENINEKYQCAKRYIEQLKINENHKEKSTEKHETSKSLQNSSVCDETSPRVRKSEEFKITNKNRRYHLHDSLRPLVSAQATVSSICLTSEQTGFKKQFVNKEIQVELTKSSEYAEEMYNLKKELEKEKMNCTLVKKLCRQRKTRIIELEEKYEK